MILILLVGLAISVECLFRLPFSSHLNRLNITVQRAARLVQNPKVSDHWKERALPAYSGRIIVSSVLAFATLLLALAPIALAVMACEWFWSKGDEAFAFLISWQGIVLMSVAGMAFAWARAQLVKHSTDPLKQGQ